MSWGVVVPSNRPDRLADWAALWHPIFDRHDARVYVIFDGDAEAEFSWRNIPEWVPRRTDMIRSWGIYQAWRDDHDYVVSLDDDVAPLPGHDLLAEYEAVFEAGCRVSPYLDVGALTSADLPMRGFPLGDRERRLVAIQYGGWNGVLDYDAETQIAGVPDSADFAPVSVPVPVGAAVTGCAMNMAWQHDFAPLLWQLPLFEGRYNRFGDIWSGLLAKAVCDRHRLGVVVNGAAAVHHLRASDPKRNRELERPGLPRNEHLWAALRTIRPAAARLETYREAVVALAGSLDDPPYARHLLACADSWLELFD